MTSRLSKKKAGKLYEIHLIKYILQPEIKAVPQGVLLEEINQLSKLTKNRFDKFNFKSTKHLGNEKNLFVILSVCLFIYLSFGLHICLSIMYVFVCLSISVLICICQQFISLCQLPIYLPIFQSIFFVSLLNYLPSICQSISACVYSLKYLQAQFE